MIEVATRELVDWLRAQSPDALVVLGLPGEAASEPKINIHLLEITENVIARRAPPRGARGPWQLSLRYLAIPAAPRPEEAMALFGRLLSMLDGHPRIIAEPTVLEPALWLALRVLPQPALRLQVPLELSRDEPELPRVKRPLDVDLAAMPSPTAPPSEAGRRAAR